VRLRAVPPAAVIVCAVALALLWPGEARSVEGEPVFAGIWSEKDPAGTGGFFYDLTWEKLVARWKELGAQGQYLADVEAYRRDGQWQFAAVWRRGPGNGALLLAAWKDFVKAWQELKASQDLIDLEVVGDGEQRKFLGVWRRKQDGDLGEGPARRHELGRAGREARGARPLALPRQHRCIPRRRQACLCRRLASRSCNGGLYRYTDWPAFLARKESLDKTQDMLDFEAFQAGDGAWTFIGIWRVAPKAARLDASSSDKEFVPLSATQFTQKWQARSETASLTRPHRRQRPRRDAR
jgi:hypothetical protein